MYYIDKFIFYDKINFIRNINMIKIDELKNQVEKNKKRIKNTNAANIAITLGSIGLGVAALVAFGPVVTGITKTFVSLGVSVLTMLGVVASNSWAIKKTTKLKKENNGLSFQIEKREYEQKIQDMETQQQLQEELKNDNVQTTQNTVNKNVKEEVIEKQEEIVK